VLTKRQMQEMLAERGLAPKKSLGQNFLVDHNLLAKLVDAADVSPGAAVLEIGPGAGVLTRELLERGARVVAVELDAGLADLLRDTLLPHHPDALTLIEGDALPSGRLHPDALAALAGAAWTMVANLPYGAASPILVDALARRPACRGVHVTIQKEDADRVLATPGTKDYGALGVICQAMAEGEVICKAPGSCFWPPPKVTSAMISLRRRPEPLTTDPGRLERFARQLFMKRRKQLGSILGRDPVQTAGLDPAARSEALTVPKIVALMDHADPAPPPPKPPA